MRWDREEDGLDGEGKGWRGRQEQGRRGACFRRSGEKDKKLTNNNLNKKPETMVLSIVRISVVGHRNKARCQSLSPGNNNEHWKVSREVQ